MVKRIGTSRSKSRHKFSKHHREKGTISLTRYLQEFKAGETVGLAAEPAVHKGMYHGDFHGKTAVVKGKRGRCYVLAFNDKGKEKTLIVHPVHLLKLK